MAYFVPFINNITNFMSCHSYDLEMPSSCSTAERLSTLVDAPMNCVQMAAAALARRYMQEGMAPSEAAKTAAADSGLKKGDIYRLLTE